MTGCRMSGLCGLAGLLILVGACAVRHSAPLPPTPGSTVTNSLGMTFAWIPPGEFLMGSAGGNPVERPVHRVRITRGFYLGTTEVTRAQWRQVMETAPWAERNRQPDGDDLPATAISWPDARAFVKRLNQRGDGHYRLPTEAEWERACRAGTQTMYYWGEKPDPDGAWEMENAGFRVHPVAKLRPNAWGLYDMLGNAWEWCADYYRPNYYGRSPSVDPPGPDRGELRVLRGGNVSNGARGCRPAARYWGVPAFRTEFDGFRVVWDGATDRHPQ